MKRQASVVRKGEAIEVLLRPRQRWSPIALGLLAALLALLTWPFLTIGTFAARGHEELSTLVVSYWATLVVLVACCLLYCAFGLVVIAVSEERVRVFYGLFGLRFETNSWPTSVVKEVCVVETVRKGESSLRLELQNESYRLPASLREDDARRISEVMRYFFS